MQVETEQEFKAEISREAMRNQRYLTGLVVLTFDANARVDVMDQLVDMEVRRTDVNFIEQRGEHASRLHVLLVNGDKTGAEALARRLNSVMVAIATENGCIARVEWRAALSGSKRVIADDLLTAIRQSYETKTTGILPAVE